MFKCDLSNRKKCFYRAFNSVYGGIGRYASIDVVVDLVKKKCLPVLLYGSEVLFLTASNFKMLDYVINGVFRKIFNTKSNEVTSSCREAFGIKPVKETIQTRREVFLHRVAAVNTHLSAILE